MAYPMMQQPMMKQPMKADGDGGIMQQPGMAQPAGGNSLMDMLGSFLGNQAQNFQGVLSNPMLIPSLGAAMQQFNQSRQYTDMAEQYASRLDPFGAQRPFYQDRLRNSYEDENSVLQSPAYQRRLQGEMDNLAHQQASQGYMGSGNMMQALMDHQRTADDSYLQQYRQGLLQPAGAHIGPEASASMLQTGLLGRMGAENNAVGSLMFPFMNQNANNQAPGGGKAPGTPGGADLLGQATQMLRNPGSLPEAMRSWSPQQLSQWLRYNNPLGNDAMGQFLTRGDGGDLGGQFDDYTLSNWRGDGQFDSSGNPWDPEDMSGWMGDMGGYGDPYGAGGLPSELMPIDGSIGDFADFDFGSDDWSWMDDFWGDW